EGLSPPSPMGEGGRGMRGNRELALSLYPSPTGEGLSPPSPAGEGGRGMRGNRELALSLYPSPTGEGLSPPSPFDFAQDSACGRRGQGDEGVTVG
ncbi:hypothetical protein PMG25_22980, partial [Roseofilum sp. BLCC_M114]